MCADCDWEDFVEMCKEFEEECELIETNSDAGRDFLLSVLNKTADMLQWAEEKRHCTDKMKKALEGMQSGARRWDRSSY